MQTFPELTRYKWEGQSVLTVAAARALMRAGLQGSKSSPRYIALSQVIEAIDFLVAERGVTSMSGDKLKRLLVRAAANAGWYRKAGNYKAVPAAVDPNCKVCRRCKQEKPLAVFNAVATEAQKRRSNWSVNAQHFISSLLCDKCRKAKTQERSRKAARADFKSKAPDLIAKYRDSIGCVVNSTRSSMKAHTTTLPATDGTVLTVLHFTHDEDKWYYEKRLELATIARNRLKDRIDDGSLSAPMDNGKPPRGLWQELLTSEERMQLHELYQAGSWLRAGFRGTIPKLWDDGAREDARTLKRERAEHAMSRSQRMVATTTQATPVSTIDTLPADSTPWEDM